jgi:hypothetical protein
MTETIYENDGFKRLIYTQRPSGSFNFEIQSPESGGIDVVNGEMSPDTTEWEVDFTGYVKADGCGNFFSNGIHVCGREQMQGFIKLLQAIHDLMPVEEY